MPTKLFASMGFTICAFVFIVLVFVMYLSKKKFREFENKIFLFMLILDFFLLINEFLYIYAMYAELDGGFIFLKTKPLCYIYIFGCIIWLVCLVLYVWALGKKNKQDALFKKEKRKMLIVLSLLALIMFIISFVLPIYYPTSNSNLYVFSGPAVYTVYIIGILVLLMVIVSVIKNGASIPEEQKKPIYFCLFILIIVNSIQLIYDLDYNSLTFLYTFVITTLYFTIESQDYKLVDDLEKKRNELIIADKAQTEFLTNMSHEIRTPLNTILGFSDSLLSEKKLTQELIDRDVSMINSASINLLDLINNILDISRIESGKEKLEEKDYILESLIEDIENQIIPKIESKKINFEINIDSNMPKACYGDYQKIVRIMLCVLNNALKYTSFGEILLEINGSFVDKEYFEFNYTISNTGHEMSYENFNLDFNDFLKLGTGNQNSIDSVSLGIIISKRLTDMLGGEMKFINESGHGTRYIITFKQKVIDKSKIGNIKKINNNKKLDKIDCSNKKVLIVDDNNLNLKLANRLLLSYGFNIDTALSGKECIDKMKKNKYDIVFLDHMMPEMDGIETLKILKSKVHKLPPVVALTANSSPGLKEKYVSIGFDDYLSKPINISDLNKLINKIFKEK